MVRGGGAKKKIDVEDKCQWYRQHVTTEHRNQLKESRENELSHTQKLCVIWDQKTYCSAFFSSASILSIAVVRFLLVPSPNFIRTKSIKSSICAG